MSIVVEPFVSHLTQTHARAPQPLARNGRHLDRQLRAGAERTLWNHLRDGRLGGARFRRQYLVDIYLADFICPAAKLVIELESTLTPALALHANARRAFFHAQGYQVLRMRDRDVLIETRAVLDTIRQALTFGSRDAGR
jgi:very-short-patch-repair endonuclease